VPYLCIAYKHKFGDANNFYASIKNLFWPSEYVNPIWMMLGFIWVWIERFCQYVGLYLVNYFIVHKNIKKNKNNFNISRRSKDASNSIKNGCGAKIECEWK